jgi:hypothetical protein
VAIVQIAKTRHPDLPQVPLIMDYVKTPENKAMWNVILAMASVGRPVTAPPGIPAELTRTLRAAFTATMKGPRFRRRDGAHKARADAGDR